MKWHTWIATVGLALALASPGCNCSSNATGSCANGQACPANSTCNTVDNLCFPNDAGGTGGTSSSSGGGCINMGSCYGNVACPVGSTCDEATTICCAYNNASGGGSGQGGSGGSTSHASGGASGQGASGGGVTGTCANGQACPTGSICDTVNGNCYAGGNAGSCANGQTCPPGSTCNNGICYVNSSGGSSGASGSGASSSGTVTGGCANGQACPAGSSCDSANGYCYADSCTGGATCPAGSTCNTGTGLCYPSGSGSSGGGSIPIVTGTCVDGGVCPAGSTCITATGLCEGTYNGGASGGGGSSSGFPFFWSGSSGSIGASGGASGQVALGTCNDGGVCPKGTTCDTSDYICWGTPGSSGGNPFGGGSSSGNVNPGGPGVGTACSPTNPGGCPSGLWCDAVNSECEVPSVGEPCVPSPGPGCQGAGISCAQLQQAGAGYICAATCTSTSQCSNLDTTCQTSTEIKGKTCQPVQCSNYFGTCNMTGTNDGTCEVISFSDLFSCSTPGGCGVCVQGGGAGEGSNCDQTRGSNFCQTGSSCTANSDGNTACAPICSPWNGPTLCPYGYGCYWPIGQNIGVCLLLCPIDPLCPFSLGGDTPGGCSNCNFGASLLTGGTACVMDCPGSSYCQFISGTPIPACLP